MPLPPVREKRDFIVTPGKLKPSSAEILTLIPFQTLKPVKQEGKRTVYFDDRSFQSF